MDSLLAGTLILPKRVHCAGYDVQRRRALKKIPGIAKTIPGSGENRSPSRRNHCSPSARNPVRVHPGILFALPRNPHLGTAVGGGGRESNAKAVSSEVPYSRGIPGRSP